MRLRLRRKTRLPAAPHQRPTQVARKPLKLGTIEGCDWCRFWPLRCTLICGLFRLPAALNREFKDEPSIGYVR